MAPLTQNEAWVNHKELVHHVPKGSSSPSSTSQLRLCLVFPICLPDALAASSASPTPDPASYIQLPFGPHPIWGVSLCHSSPCATSLFLLAPNLTSHFTQQDLSQAKLFLNSCLAIIRITPGDSWARAGKPEGKLSCPHSGFYSCSSSISIPCPQTCPPVSMSQAPKIPGERDIAVVTYFQNTGAARTSGGLLLISALL